MKILVFSFVILCACFSIARASHHTAADIRYEYTGTGNIYKVYLTLHEVCQQGSLSLSPNESVTIKSLTTNTTVNRSLKIESVDSNVSQHCPSVTNSCQNPVNATYLGYTTIVYTDTISLQPAPDWVMSFTGNRSQNPMNIQSPSTQGLYVESLLNNSAGHNSSTWIVNRPPLLVAVNSMNENPLNTVDFDNDSITYEICRPQKGPGQDVSYVIGYDLAHPMGPGGAIQLSGNTLQITPTAAGMYVMAIRVKEYRNGVLVGSTTRDWGSYCFSIPPFHNPGALPASATTVLTYPGQPHNISLSFSNGSATDTMVAEMQAINNGVTFTSTAMQGIGSAQLNIIWTTPATFNAATTPYFYIPIMCRTSACANAFPVQGITYYVVKVVVSADPLGIGSATKAGLDMKIVPNPSIDRAVLNMNMTTRQTVRLRVTDIAGRVVWAGQKDVDAGASEMGLPAQILSPGMYIIDAVTANGKQQRLKWIKQ